MDSKYTVMHEIDKIIVHPQYKRNPLENDLALFHTKVDIEWSFAVGPICLPPFNKK